MLNLSEMSSAEILAALDVAYQDCERQMYEAQRAYRNSIDDITLGHQRRVDELRAALIQAEAREHERRRNSY